MASKRHLQHLLRHLAYSRQAGCSALLSLCEASLQQSCRGLSTASSRGPQTALSPVNGHLQVSKTVTR